MKLTVGSRAQILNLIEHDIPKISDEDLKKMAAKIALSYLPTEALPLYKTHPGMFMVANLNFAITLANRKTGQWYVTVPSGGDYGGVHTRLKQDKNFIAALTQYLEAVEARTSTLREIGNVIRGFTTTQALVKAIPEFEKYSPKEAPEKHLPMVTGVIGKLSQVGWPAVG